MEANLRCRLVARGHPALLLQPVKVEEQSLDPSIVVLHDLLTDRQVDILRQLGEPKVRTSTLHYMVMSISRIVCESSLLPCIAVDKGNSSAV